MRHQSRDYTRIFLFVWWIIHCTRILYIGEAAEGTAFVEEGSLGNQLEFITLFAVSTVYFRPAWSRLKAAKGVWFYSLCLYAAWSFVSIVWSADMLLSLRRYLLFFIELVSWIGLGAGYYGGGDGPKRLCRDVRYACMALIALSLPIVGPELTLTNLFNPFWESSIRQTGPFIVETSVLGLLSCFIFLPAAKSQRTGFRIYAVPATLILAFLLITKGRSAIAMTSLILGFTFTRILKNRLARVCSQGILLILVGVFIANFSTSFLQETVIGEYLSRGNNVQTLEALNGRTPLWEYVMFDIQQRPLLGFGFGAYWTADRMGTVWSHFRWHAPVAHNGYLDETVQTGLVGLTLMLVFLFGSIKSVRKYQKGFPEATVAVPWICLFLLLNLTDSYFQNSRRIAVILTMTMTFSCLSVVGEVITSRKLKAALKKQFQGAEALPEHA